MSTSAGARGVAPRRPGAGVTAVVLAAGRGSRLGALTDRCPKPLLPLHGSTTLLGRQLELMAERGIERVTVVVGYRGDALRAALGRVTRPRVELLENADWEGSGSAWSLVQAADVLRSGDPVLLTHGDIVYDGAMLDALLDTHDTHDTHGAHGAHGAHRMVTVADRGWTSLTGDEVLAFGDAGLLRGTVKGPAPADAAEHGEFVGLSRLDGGFAAGFAEHCARRAGDDRRLDYELPLLAEFVAGGGGVCEVLYTEGVPWCNVNDRDDLDHVRRHFAQSRV